jgi:hypothetical protein
VKAQGRARVTLKGGFEHPKSYEKGRRRSPGRTRGRATSPSIGATSPRRWRTSTAINAWRSHTTSTSSSCTCGAGPSNRTRGKSGAAPLPASASPSIISGR